jgi:hypothetical protein
MDAAPYDGLCKLRQHNTSIPLSCASLYFVSFSDTEQEIAIGSQLIQLWRAFVEKRCAPQL